MVMPETVNGFPDEDADDWIKVPAPGKKTLEFQGELLGEVSTETEEEPRWLEIELYRFTDGTGRYLLLFIGKSLVYHTRNSRCNRGVLKPLKEFPPDPVPCERCRPPEIWEAGRLLVPEDSLFDLELDRPTPHVCATAEEVIDKLRIKKPPPGSRLTPGSFSSPASRLLEGVSSKDPNIAQVITIVERL